LKKLFLIFTFLVAFIFTSAEVMAAPNSLHTITLEKSSTGYNIILGSDKVAKVVKKTPSDNELVLDLLGVTSSETVNALYKGTNNIDSLVIENSQPNRLKVYIKADNIKESTIIVEPIIGETTIVGESLPVDKIVWAVFVLALFGVIFKISKDISEEDDKLIVRKSIKDREIELYRKYKNQISSTQNISIGEDLRMKKMLKKIDRKIDERLSSSVSRV